MCFYKGHYGFQDIDNIQVSRSFLKHSLHALTVKKWSKSTVMRGQPFFPLFKIPVPFLIDEIFCSYVSV